MQHGEAHWYYPTKLAGHLTGGLAGQACTSSAEVRPRAQPQHEEMLVDVCATERMLEREGVFPIEKL